MADCLPHTVDPPISNSKTTQKIIRPLSTPSNFTLSVSSTNPGSSVSKNTEYTGAQQGSDEAAELCVLIFSASKQSFILDRLDSNIVFHQKGKIQNGASGHNALHNDEDFDDSDEGLFGDEKDEDESQVADASNPYDYRHFIKSASPSSAGSQASSRQQSPAQKPSPYIKPSSTFKPSPLNGAHRPIQQPKSRSNPKPKPDPKPPRTILPEASPPLVPSPFGNHSSDADDDDVLTIELDDGPPKRKNHFHNAFKNLQGDGPISMRSAASSVSPGVLNHGIDEDEDEDEVLELEGAEEAESDEDVEEGEQFRLPSPVVGRAATEEEEEEEEESDVDEEEPQRVPVYEEEKVEAEEENDIDEFSAAIARGFEQQQENGGVGLGVDLGTGVGQVVAPMVTHYESSSESEAE